jgi:hypothetical protein
MGQKVAGAPKLSTVQVFFGGKMSRGKLSVGCYAAGRNVRGVKCPWGELSMGRVVNGGSCPWGKLQ